MLSFSFDFYSKLDFFSPFSFCNIILHEGCPKTPRNGVENEGSSIVLQGEKES